MKRSPFTLVREAHAGAYPPCPTCGATLGNPCVGNPCVDRAGGNAIVAAHKGRK